MTILCFFIGVAAGWALGLCVRRSVKHRELAARHRTIDAAKALSTLSRIEGALSKIDKVNREPMLSDRPAAEPSAGLEPLARPLGAGSGAAGATRAPGRGESSEGGRRPSSDFTGY